MARRKGGDEPPQAPSNRSRRRDAPASGPGRDSAAQTDAPGWTLAPITETRFRRRPRRETVAHTVREHGVVRRPWWFRVLIAPLLVAGATVGIAILAWFLAILIRVL